MDFPFYLFSRFLALTAAQMFALGVGQAVYEITHDPLHLGLVGLALFAPKFGFALHAGHVADRYDRFYVVLACRALQVMAGLLIACFAYYGLQPLWILYVLIFLVGTGNAFEGPASQSLVPHLVAPSKLDKAVAWNASAMQFAFIAGPALGGFVYASFGRALPVFIVIAVIRLLALIFFTPVKTRTGGMDKTTPSWEGLLAGLKYVFTHRTLLGLISLDLFAVLLGGAVSLMPIFANDILKVGPQGLGWLRSAPAVGAALMAFVLSRRKPLQNAGQTMLQAVAVFGLATVVFGLSRDFGLSLLSLVVLGASDMISMVVRGVMVQTLTPPSMRGRVSAVNLVFIGASNELGEFESGVTARWWGTVPAVIVGGLGTLAIVGAWHWLFPEIRKLKQLDGNL